MLFLKTQQWQIMKKFFDFKIESVNGERINFDRFKDKAVLVVNTASYCGFTKQYDELQELWNLYKDKGLIVLGVPSNSFNQEKKKTQKLKNSVKLILILTSH